MTGFSTGAFRADLYRCDDIGQLKEQLLPLLRDQRSAWKEKIDQILSDRNYTCGHLARLCRVSEPAVRKWRRGALPQSRDMYIRIGFAAGYDLGQMNAFLKRYGKCPQLYAKSLEDSVCIFVLSSSWIPHTYASYADVLDLVRQELCGAEDEQAQTCYTTGTMGAYLLDMRTLEELTAFARVNAAAYRQAYAKFYGYVISYLQANLQSEHTIDGDGRRASFHAMATESQWSSSLRHCVSEIRNRRWFPLRHKVISLGIHLNMDTEAINTMLQYAQMEPLYAGSPLEAAVMWALEEAKLCSEHDAIIPDGSSDLCDFVKDILVRLDLSEEGRGLVDDL